MTPTIRAHNPCALAIETSTPHGSITLGHATHHPATDTPPHADTPHADTPHAANPHAANPHARTIIATATLPQQRRHNVDLMPTIAQLCDQHTITRHDITEIYVSVGPGSFTGLRIALATVKMLAMTLGTKIVAVPTLDVIAKQIPPQPNTQHPDGHLAIGMSLKHDTFYSAIYQWQPDLGWQSNDAPQLRTIAQLLAPPHHTHTTPRPPLTIVTQTPVRPSPDAQIARLPDGVIFLDSAMAQPTSNSVYVVGRAMALRGDYSDPHQLTPLYVRRPEAEELWNARRNARPDALPNAQQKNNASS